MHFGSIKNFNQESKEFSETTLCKDEERALAKACLARLGINRMVAYLRLKTSSRKGKYLVEEHHWSLNYRTGYQGRLIHMM